MFNSFFASLSNLANETRLLEACGWDEGRAEKIKDIFSESIEKIMNESNSDSKDVINKIRSEMSSYATPTEIDILVEMLEVSIINASHVVQEEYEN